MANKSQNPCCVFLPTSATAIFHFGDNTKTGLNDALISTAFKLARARSYIIYKRLKHFLKK